MVLVGMQGSCYYEGVCDDNMKKPAEVVEDIRTKLNLSKIPNWPRECRGVKLMQNDGWDDDQIVEAYMRFKRKEFWRDKYLSTMYVYANIESAMKKEDKWQDVDLGEWANENN